MIPLAKLLKPRWERFRADQRGGMMMVFAISLPVLALGIAASLDYVAFAKAKAQLQTAVDSAALASARELRLSSTNQSILDAAAQSVFHGSLASPPWGPSATAATSLVNSNSAVQVSGQATVPAVFGTFLTPQSVTINATATASVKGGSPICLIALNPSAHKSLEADQTALVTAAGCAIYSDSTASNSIIAKGHATITAALICSAGGAAGNTSGLTPAPTQCAAIPDPMASRAAPTYAGSCDQTNLIVSGGTQSLNPGVYCGGLHIACGAVVTVNPGVFVISGGPLIVDGGSSLTGSNVGFYLTGTGAALNFAAGANTINLTAPTTGALAGLLFFEDRANTAGVSHIIESDNARNLLGTIYLSRGVLSVGSNARVADLSAYTIIVADSVVLTGGPNMILNANYSSSAIPTPSGVGPSSTYLQN